MWSFNGVDYLTDATKQSESFIYTKEALLSAVDNFTKKREHIPFYDSDDPKTRKEIGRVVDVWYDGEDNGLFFTAELKDGKFIKGKAG